MRNAFRFLAILGVAVVVLAAATPASANCIPAKIASTFSADVSEYIYLAFGPGVTKNDVTATFYQKDCAGGVSSVAYPASDYFLDASANGLEFTANLGDARVAGCPSQSAVCPGPVKLVMRIQANTPTGPKFLVLTAVEGAHPNTAFAYFLGRTTGSSITAASLPRPRVTSSARAGSLVNLQLALDATTAGSQGDADSAVTGYDIVKATGADPGNNAAAWTLVQNVPTTNGAAGTVTFSADCSNPTVDQFFATRLTFSDGQKSDLVSDPTRVNCNPALAEPRFNVVPKKPTGPKKAPARQ